MDFPSTGFQRRYRFYEWLGEYPTGARYEMMLHLQAELSITKQTLNRWLDVSAREKYDVPYGAVLRISQILGKDPNTAYIQRDQKQAA